MDNIPKYGISTIWFLKEKIPESIRALTVHWS